jgi:hypothetical protein
MKIREAISQVVKGLLQPVLVLVPQVSIKDQNLSFDSFHLKDKKKLEYNFTSRFSVMML